MALHKARVEKRVKEVAPGEAATIDTLALVAEPMKIVEALKPVANKAAPTDEEVAEVVDGFFAFYDPEGAKAMQGSEVLPTRPPPGEPDAWVKPVVPAEGKTVGPLRRRLGIIDLNVLKRQAPAGGQNRGALLWT